MLVERNPKLLEAVKSNAAPTSQKASLLATRKVFLLASGHRSAYPTMQLWMRVAGLTGQLVLLRRVQFPRLRLQLGADGVVQTKSEIETLAK